MAYVLYKIQSRVSARAYIGLTKNFAARVSRYKSNPHGLVGRAIRKHGFEKFEFTVIASAYSKEDAIATEILLIAEHNTKYPNGYNLTDGGEGHNGQAVSETTKAKMSAVAIKRGVSKDRLDKMHAARRGSHHSEDTKLRISLSNKATMAENAARASFIGDWNRGRKKSPETLAKLREIGRKTVLTAAQKQKHKAAMKSLRWVTDGTKNSRINFDAALPLGWRYGRS